jgi:periplasmic divalent cation tolerance protein
MTDIVQLTTTVDSKSRAIQLAETIVTERLAACAQVQGPIESVYWWQGKVDSATEWYCHFKTTKLRMEHLRTRVVKLHPYDVPEVIVVPVVDGHPPYVNWVASDTRPPTSDS